LQQFRMNILADPLRKRRSRQCPERHGENR
jgi:hypothetical protein